MDKKLKQLKESWELFERMLKVDSLSQTKYVDGYNESVDKNTSEVLYEDYSPIVIKASELAKKAHEGQFRRGSGDEYIVHPDRIVKKLISHGLTDDKLISSAWLHDTFEDGTPEIRQEIESEIPEEVVSIIDYLSKREGETKMDYLRRCFSGPIEVKLIKVADRIDNLSDGLGTQDPEWLARYYKSSKFIRDSVKDINSSLVDEYLELFERTYGESNG